MKNTALIYHPDYLLHDTGAHHPETAERLKVIIAALKDSPLEKRLKWIVPDPVPEDWIEHIHSREYMNFVKTACESGQPFLDAGDTCVCKDSFRIALLAAGGVLRAVDEVVLGNMQNAFCAVRPPGHHAERDRAMGFCLFNNVAVGASYALKKHDLKKVLIVDWDVHHGNGTQNSFYDDPAVGFFSIHQHPHYPGTGLAQETGAGKGMGFTLNVPVPQASGDAEYIDAFNNQLLPLADIIKPDLVIISAGFDASIHDSLSGTAVTREGYNTLSKIVKSIAKKHAQERLVSVLEGGYDLSGLPILVMDHIAILNE
jgi:acetoin utilization deacetylase AcuC-like enzyme